MGDPRGRLAGVTDRQEDQTTPPDPGQPSEDIRELAGNGVGDTFFTLAAYYDQPATVRRPMEVGADVEKPNDCGQHLLPYTTFNAASSPFACCSPLVPIQTLAPPPPARPPKCSAA